MQIRPGDTVTATLDTTDGRTVTADVAADRVDRLGCGCLRVRATRPGPQVGPYVNWVEMLTGCAVHDRGITAVNPAAPAAA